MSEYVARVHVTSTTTLSAILGTCSDVDAVDTVSTDPLISTLSLNAKPSTSLS